MYTCIYVYTFICAAYSGGAISPEHLSDIDVVDALSQLLGPAQGFWLSFDAAARLSVCGNCVTDIVSQQSLSLSLPVALSLPLPLCRVRARALFLCLCMRMSPTRLLYTQKRMKAAAAARAGPGQCISL